MTTSLVNEFKKAEAKRENLCPTCGQELKHLNPHSMDRSKVEVLEAIAMLNTSGIEWVKVQRDGRLIKPEARERTIQRDDVHALRLKWFGLLRSKGYRTGMYQATLDGFGFLAGTVSVPRTIKCKDGTVEFETRERVFINQVRGIVHSKEYWENYWKLQLQDRRFA